MTIDSNILTEMPAEPATAIVRRIRDGDLFLCSGNDPFSRLIGWATKSPWTHVAMAYRWHSLGKIMVFESVQQYGVRAVSLKKFLSQSSTGQKPYPGKILLARHDGYEDRAGKGHPTGMKHLVDFAVDQFGDPFAGGEIVKIATRIMVGRLNRPMPKPLWPKDEYICSEYVAKCFDAVGIEIPWDGRGFIAPADFANDPSVRAIARFDMRQVQLKG